jgi:putative transposase
MLSSQIKQSILARIGDAIHALAVKKAKGFKVGALKFRSIIESIPLKQFGVTYRIRDDRHVAIQGLSSPMRVFGIEQFDDAEIANAHFLQRGTDYYLHVTTYRDKGEEPEKEFGNVGIDFNIEAGCQMVFHNGVAIGFETRSDTDPRIKGLQRKLARQDRTNKKKPEALSPVPADAKKSKKGKKKKGKKAKPVSTKNRAKTKNKLKKAYEPLNNKKKEIVGAKKCWAETCASQPLPDVQERQWW